ncbi:MAG: hypothetical protein HQK53_08850 [Oligoflexia bacterium]|nr:hypothetical protein [Oligoflexia bacterium]
MKKYYNIAMVIGLLIFLPFNAYSSEEKWTSGPVRGHEDITRFAVLAANKFIGHDFYPVVAYGDSGLISKNFLIQGNYQTDFPSATLCRRYHIDLKDCNLSRWQNNPELQIIHSLRNLPNGQKQEVPTLLNTLQGIRQIIIQNTAYALQFHQQGKENLFFFWIGHVVHTIQDSFSPAHVKRNPNTLGIIDMCIYGKKVDQVCYHHLLDTGDYIWVLKWGCLNGRSFACLKDEAVDAVKASAEYLETVYRFIQNNLQDDFDYQDNDWEKNETKKRNLNILFEDYLNRYFKNIL